MVPHRRITFSGCSFGRHTRASCFSGRPGGGSFDRGTWLAGLLFYSGIGVSLVTGLSAGLFVMEMVRMNALKKWQGILAVLLSSAVSAIAPPMILGIKAQILLLSRVFSRSFSGVALLSASESLPSWPSASAFYVSGQRSKPVNGDVVDSRG